MNKEQLLVTNLGIYITQHVLGNQMQSLIEKRALAKQVLQTTQDGNHPIATVNIEHDLRDWRAIQLELFTMGNSHRNRASLR